MKTKYLYHYILLIISLLVFSSCNKKSNLSDSIPADAFYVLRVDAESLIKKSEYNLFQNPIIQQGVNFSKPFMTDAQKKLLDNFMNDANALGLDLKGEYFTYMSDSELGLVMKVFDAKKIKNNLLTISGNDEVVVEDGFYIIKSKQWAVVWNNDKLIFLSHNQSNNPDNSFDINNLVLNAKNHLSQTKENSISSIKEYNTFLTDATDVSAYYSINKMLSWIQINNTNQNYLSSEAANSLSNVFDGVSIAAYTSFEKGKIEVNQNFLYDSDKTEQRLKTFASQFLSPIKGDQFKYVPQDNILLVSANLQGKNLETFLHTNKIFDQFTESTGDTISDKSKQILSSIDGDVTLFISDFNFLTNGATEQFAQEISDADSSSLQLYQSIEEVGNNSDRMEIQMGVFAQVANDDSLATLLEENSNDTSNNIEKLSSKSYKLINDSQNTVYFGLKDNLFYATTLQNVYEAIVEGKAIVNPYSGDHKKDDLFFLQGNFNKLASVILSSPNVAQLSDIDKYKPIFSLLDAYQLSVKAQTLSMSGYISFNDKTENSLKTICYTLDEFARSSMSGIFGNLF